ncbi:hypothetical protein ACWCWD_06235 [Streptomyces sp. NPDC001493]
MTDTTVAPAGRALCLDCLGAGRVANPYAHTCNSPACQDPAVVQCPECDGQGTVAAQSA